MPQQDLATSKLAEQSSKICALSRQRPLCKALAIKDYMDRKLASIALRTKTRLCRTPPLRFSSVIHLVLHATFRFARHFTFIGSLGISLCASRHWFYSVPASIEQAAPLC